MLHTTISQRSKLRNKTKCKGENYLGDQPVSGHHFMAIPFISHSGSGNDRQYLERGSRKYEPASAHKDSLQWG